LIPYAQELLAEPTGKRILVSSPYFSNTHPSRLHIFYREKPSPIDVFYRSLSLSKYVLSPEGDRPDCYRHYECIGLGAIPISNIDQFLYKDIFGDSMLFAPAVSKMVSMYEFQHIERGDVAGLPNRDLIVFDYWKDQLIIKLSTIKTTIRSQ
jgi:hypothetical protein